MKNLKKYNRLRELLSEQESWPLLYMFKFIVPNRDGKVNEVLALLPKEGELSFNHTKNLRHVAITCKAKMASADDIVWITMKASEVGGVMAL